MISWRGAVWARSAVSDLERNTPAPETHRDHGKASGSGRALPGSVGAGVPRRPARGPLAARRGVHPAAADTDQPGADAGSIKTADPGFVSWCGLSAGLSGTGRWAVVGD